MSTDESIDSAAGRAISRKVLAEMSAGFREPWRRALEFQQRNPDVQAAALRAPTDFGEAAETMVPFFALLHPSLLRTAVAHCDAVVAEFAVTPSWQPDGVASDRDLTTLLERLERLEEMEETVASLQEKIARLTAADGAEGRPVG